jgi:hypothetical protein
VLTRARPARCRAILPLPTSQSGIPRVLLGHGLGDKCPYSREINERAMFSAAAFAVEHQDEAGDEIAPYSAGGRRKLAGTRYC